MPQLTLQNRAHCLGLLHQYICTQIQASAWQSTESLPPQAQVATPVATAVDWYARVWRYHRWI